MLREVEEHLRLAEGFISTASVSSTATECEIRNALSRAYYAVMHICHGWLAMHDVPLAERDKHWMMHEEIRKSWRII
jgi:uncharacterized protein (UPF0332 family)